MSEKALTIKEKIEKKIEQDGFWSSPRFNNAGFFVGILVIFISIFNFYISLFSIGDKFPLWACLMLFIFGAYLMLVTPVIHLTSKSIEFQPLLTNLLFPNLNRKSIFFDNIRKVTKFQPPNNTGPVRPPIIIINIYTKDLKKIKLNRTYFNSEVANGLHKIFTRKNKVDF